MNIIVLVKQVPNTSEIKIDKVTNTLIRAGVASIINPDDLAGVEEALKLREKYGGTVTCVTMGPPQAEKMVYELYSLGVDYAYLISDGKFAGSDTFATSTILSSFLKTLDYDLIIAGYQALDGDTAQVGPQVAELLNIPQVGHLSKIVSVEDNVLTVLKETDSEELTIEVTLPALVTTLRKMNKPRYMNTWDIMTAPDKPYTLVKFGDFDVNVNNIGLKGSPTTVSKTYTKPLTQKAPQKVVTPEEASDIILKVLYPYLGDK